jgi:hypothetical protein
MIIKTNERVAIVVKRMRRPMQTTKRDSPRVDQLLIPAFGNDSQFGTFQI